MHTERAAKTTACADAHCSASAPAARPAAPGPSLRWDIFCHVVDNWGDAGVCWRLCRQLAAAGQQVRLWIDDPSLLALLAPEPRHGADAAVAVHPWPRTQPTALPPPLPPSDVLVEAFGCHVPDTWVAARLPATSPEGAHGIWLNLEYLSAEPWVARSHGLPSPVLHGPLRGRTKWFFFPGFTPDTGGLLREADLLARQQAFDEQAWRARQGPHSGPWVSLFCYEPPALAALVAQPALAHARWLVAAGRSAAAWQRTAAAALPVTASACIQPTVPQPAFDERLWACDLNLVRGEDSLVRALWAGRPFLWQIYPQDDDAHHVKLEAFLRWLDAPPHWQAWLRAWNGVPGAVPPALTADDLAAWTEAARTARQRLLAQDDLLTRLLAFVHAKRASG
ncbi:hypothetical protein Tchar_01360 [Tepidimonas charontis]|uniref:Protein-arginine rhamnosyltransferase n=2 Tax=Tepidimonas charontis TaxID=2267262 RepID=A0A554XFC7_9BURK|nr:hypothetical protein Tchar_01360 [Tepidimonas charontis]